MVGLLRWPTCICLYVVLAACGALATNSHQQGIVDLSGAQSTEEDQGGSFQLTRQQAKISRSEAARQERSKVKTGKVGRLGEGLNTKTKVNPDCVGAKIPACKHGEVDQDACKCKCPFNWLGRLCQTCNAGACKNGKMSKSCKCICDEGFHGIDCSKGSKCLNGAVQVGNSCKCKNAWSGPTCKVCDLMCLNGGQPNKAVCSCSCPVNRAPPLCKACRDPGCLNGGIFRNKKTKEGKELCGCRCKEKHAFVGLKCEKCKNPGCARGTWDAGKCLCKCPNKNWSGNKCDECKLHCSDGKKRDPKTCTCVDGGNVNYNPCIVGCRHGTLDKKTCKCKCKPGFKGIFCDTCKIKKCFNGGALDHKKTCKCKCKAPWKGKTCKQCTLNCGAHGKVKPKCGGCLCEKTALGVFTGKKCDKCDHPPCKNGGTVDMSSCKCSCPKGYNGADCGTCFLKQKDCKNGSILKPSECKCECDKGTAATGDWSGQLCGQCTHRGCKNGGEVNRKTCRCECIPLWKGRYCAACGHPFCKATPTLLGRGKNEVKDFPSDPNCAWARSKLGCPGGVN